MDETIDKLINLEKALRALGIPLKEKNGDFRDTLSILAELSQGFENHSGTEKKPAIVEIYYTHPANPDFEKSAVRYKTKGIVENFNGKQVFITTESGNLEIYNTALIIAMRTINKF